MSRSGAGGRARELGSFAAVGLLAYLVDVGVFNALLLGTATGPVAAKLVSSAVAVAVAFAGSRWFTWRHRRSDRPLREYALFMLVSAAAAGLQLLCLLVSRDLLGLTSALADNVSANVVGMALATAFRFWGFRTVVFRERPAVPGSAQAVTRAGAGRRPRAGGAARS